VEAPSETSDAIASLDEKAPFADTDPETEPAPAEDREGALVDGQEAPWETPQEAGEDGDPFVVDEPVKGQRVGRFLQLGSRLDVGASLRSAAGRAKEVFARVSVAAPKETTTLTIEHGYVKLLVTQGREVVDYRIVPANPRFFREGLVSDAPRIAGLLEEAIQDLSGGHKRVIAAVPGYQTNLRRIDVPNVKGMDPKVVIPNEARRTMGISPNDTRITWHHLTGTVETSSWLVVSATKRSITSISAPAASAGLATTAVELRPFAVARATNEADAVFAWAAADGCDAVVVRDWVPMTYQAAYWGAGLTMESSDLVNRIVEVVESTVDAHDIQNPEMVASRDIPIFVYGSPAAEDVGISPRVAELLGRETLEPDIPLDLPDGFPLDELIVNVGLSLWDE
jgi:hypothetical protein